MKQGIFTRFVQIWKPTFLRSFSESTEPKSRTWKFWFFWNSIASVIATIVIILLTIALVEFAQETLDRYVPDGTTLRIENERLRISAIEQPLIVGSENSLILVDTTDTLSTSEVIEKRPQLYIGSDRLIVREGNSQSMVVYPYFGPLDDAEQYVDIATIADPIWLLDKNTRGAVPFTLAKDTLRTFLQSTVYAIMIGVIVFVWIYLCLLRLISALWWAFVLWVGIKLSGRKQLSYEVCYRAVLHLYLVVLVLWIPLSFVIDPFTSTIIIFLILFVLNILKLDQQDGKRGDSPPSPPPQAPFAQSQHTHNDVPESQNPPSSSSSAKER